MKRDRTTEPISRDQSFRRERGQKNVYFPCLVDHEQDRQPYPVDPYSAVCDDHTYRKSIAVLLLRKDHERAATDSLMLSRKKRGRFTARQGRHDGLMI